MEKGITFAAVDAHKEMHSVAMLLPGQTDPVTWDVPNEPAAVRRLVRKLEREAPGEVRICYEAGPVGYALQRQITEAGSASCMVAHGPANTRLRSRIRMSRMGGPTTAPDNDKRLRRMLAHIDKLCEEVDVWLLWWALAASGAEPLVLPATRAEIVVESDARPAVSEAFVALEARRFEEAGRLPTFNAAGRRCVMHM